MMLQLLGAHSVIWNLFDPGYQMRTIWLLSTLFEGAVGIVHRCSLSLGVSMMTVGKTSNGKLESLSDRTLLKVARQAKLMQSDRREVYGMQNREYDRAWVQLEKVDSMAGETFQIEVENEQRTYTVGTGKVLQMVFLLASTGELDLDEYHYPSQWTRRRDQR